MLAILSVIESALPGSFILAGVAARLGVSWVTLSVGFNVIVTAAISILLLRMRHQMRAALGHEDARIYGGLAAMLIESCSISSIAGIAFIVPYGMNSPTDLAFTQIWGGCVVRFAYCLPHAMTPFIKS